MFIFLFLYSVFFIQDFALSPESQITEYSLYPNTQLYPRVYSVWLF